MPGLVAPLVGHAQVTRYLYPNYPKYLKYLKYLKQPQNLGAKSGISAISGNSAKSGNPDIESQTGYFTIQARNRAKQKRGRDVPPVCFVHTAMKKVAKLAKQGETGKFGAFVVPCSSEGARDQQTSLGKKCPEPP